MLTAKVRREEIMAKAGRAPHLRAVNSHAPSPRRVHLRAVEQPVTPEVRQFDPLSRERRGRGRIAFIAAVYVAIAISLHGAVILSLILYGEDQGALSHESRPETVVVQIKDPIAPPALPMPMPMPEPMPEPVPLTRPQPEALKQKREKPDPRPLTPSEPAAVSDPVDTADNRPETPEPRRKVVGINFESTVTGGKGPAFAVGNTRMGETGNRAGEGRNPPPLPKGRTSGSATASPNRVAQAIPSAGVTLEKPHRRVEIQPDYPSLLKAQGAEGDVVVLIRIDKEGQVGEVKVIKGSGYDAFDEAARKTAKSERFDPARRNGEPIEYTLKYTYRFRVMNK